MSGASGKPAGQVQFFDGTTLLGTVGINPLTNKASLQVTFATTGTHPLTARYVGSDTHASSTSAVLSQVVT